MEVCDLLLDLFEVQIGVSVDGVRVLIDQLLHASCGYESAVYTIGFAGRTDNP